jgi:hypothetical protein
MYVYMCVCVYVCMCVCSELINVAAYERACVQEKRLHSACRFWELNSTCARACVQILLPLSTNTSSLYKKHSRLTRNSRH